jgi:energy-coupling factor transporter ATP-binding protein EcfA2
MQKPNWPNFKAKFNGKEEDYFEWFCYLLFCNLYEKNTGIFRYKNHAGIETNPVEYDGETIGFQSKFCKSSPLSRKENELKDAIKTAKDRHPEIDKILFFINKSFGQSNNSNEPKYKKRIELEAEDLGVTIDWKLPSFFESPFVAKDNKEIAKYFFSKDKSLVDFVKNIQDHTKRVLGGIKNKINFHDQNIKVDRSDYIEEIDKKFKEKNNLVLFGNTGVGKSALIKDLHEVKKDSCPFYVFRGNEFSLNNINNFFDSFGDFNLNDFINEGKNFDEKYIVFDSVEKLNQVSNTKPFIDFISALEKHEWNIIFTTRKSYLGKLGKILEHSKVNSLNFLEIKSLEKDKLGELSSEYSFDVPEEKKILDLIKTPFFLKLYLNNYESISNNVGYSEFKDIIWEKEILDKNTLGRKREKCFLKIVEEKAKNNLYAKADNCDDDTLSELQSDEIIEYSSRLGGYFILHDIYEQWGLRKIIEVEFNSCSSFEEFYKNIGDSLLFRKSFRKWISKKLHEKNDEVKRLIQKTMNENDVEDFWQEEVLISVLNSEYSKKFFQKNKEKILSEEELFNKIISILQTYCKKADQDILRQLKMKNSETYFLESIFTVPKGEGWKHMIHLIENNIEYIEVENIDNILPLINEWNQNFQTGKTTKKAAKIALYYYDDLSSESGFSYSIPEERIEKIIQTILKASSQIQSDLKNIFDEVLSAKNFNQNDKYHELVKTAISSIIESAEISQAMPDYVLKLCELLWLDNQETDEEKYPFRKSRMDIEQNFGITNLKNDYFPSSAYQTPIFNLLNTCPDITIDFILDFTNKTVEKYRDSEFGNQIDKIKLYIDGEESVIQSIDNRIWNMYRGTQAAPNVLESVHMALEKWLLSIANERPKETLNDICKYLLKKSESASITAVVVSIVLANPSKLFEVLKILLKSKKIFKYDLRRLVLEQSAKSCYFPLGKEIGFNRNPLFLEEREETLEQSFRNKSLERVILKLQISKIEKLSDEKFNKRQKELWSIIDDHYKNLPKKEHQEDHHKFWRLSLARMDRRKMNPNLKEDRSGDETIIEVKPEIDQDLEEFRESTEPQSAKNLEYTSLKQWSKLKLEGKNKKAKEYKKYSNDLEKVVEETREILGKLDEDDNEKFSLINYATPVYTCSALIKYHFSDLSSQQQEFCKEVLLKYVNEVLDLKVEPRKTQGLNLAVNVTPLLIKYFPDSSKKIKNKILLLLLDSNIDIFNSTARGIARYLYEIDPESADSIFVGYLLLKSKYDQIIEEKIQENRNNGVYTYSNQSINADFSESYEQDIEDVISNDIKFNQLQDLEEKELNTLEKAIHLIPNGSNRETHLDFLNSTLPIFAEKLMNHKNNMEPNLKNRFLKKYSQILLFAEKDLIELYTKPFVNKFQSSRGAADLLSDLISQENKFFQYEQFWIIWSQFYDKVVSICKQNNNNYHDERVINNYFLAWRYWKKGASNWHSLKESDKQFFKQAVSDIGFHISFLYSVSKVLDSIGKHYLEDGIIWLSDIIDDRDKNNDYQLETNTIFHIENIVRRYVTQNDKDIKTNPRKKDRILKILDYLIEKESEAAFKIRDKIL